VVYPTSKPVQSLILRQIHSASELFLATISGQGTIRLELEKISISFPRYGCIGVLTSELRMSRARRASTLAVLFAAVSGVPAFAATPTPNLTWTSATTTNWSVGPWTPAAPVYGGAANIVPQFNNTTATAYTASNDLGASFLLNGLYLNGTSSGAIVIASAAGNSLRFISNGADLPVIQQSGAAAATVSAPIRFNTGLTIGGSGAGNLTLSGMLAGGGSLTINRNTGTVILSGMNRHTGGTTISSGILQVNTNTALGSGNVVVTGGTLRTSAVLNPFNSFTTNAQMNIAMSSAGRFTLRGNITGAGGVRNSGLGQVYLVGNNSYGGSTLIDATTAASTTEVLFFSDANLGASSTPIVFKDSTGGTGIAALTYNGTGSIELTHPISINANSEARLTPIESNATMVLSGGVSGTGDLRIGHYNFAGVTELAGTNTYSGVTWVTTGTLRFDSDTRLGNSQFIVLDGGCIMPGGNWTTSRALSINQQANTSLGTIKTSGLNTDIYTTSINGLDYAADGLSDLTLYKSGSGTLQISGAVAPSMAANAGNIVLHGAGTSSFTSATLSSIVLNRGGGLILDNSATNLANRLPDTGTISMNGGTFAVRGNLLGAASETTGAINLGTSSFSVIDLRPELLLGVNLTASSLVNGGGAGVLFRAPLLGTTSGVNFSAAPTLVGAGGAAGTPQVSIVAGGFGEDTAAGLGSGFVTYAAGGIRLLSPAEYDNTIVSGAVSNNNVSLNSAVAGINATTTINSLRLLNGSAITGSATLNVSSGNLLVPAGASASIGVGTLARSGAIHIRNNGGLTISSQLNATTVNFSGNGVSDVSGAFTGAVSIHEGTLRSGANDLIGDTQVVTINESGTWNLNGKSETIAGLTQQNIATIGAGSYGVMNINAGTLTLSPATGTTNSFSGRIRGSGKLIKTGAGSIVFNGQNSDFTGSVEIQQGVVRLNSLSTTPSLTAPAESRRNGNGDQILSCLTVNFNVSGTNSAELKLSDKISSFSRPIVVDGATSGTVRFTTRNETAISSDITLNRNLQIGSGSGVFSGTISGPGSLTVIHPDSAAIAGGFARPPITSITGNNSYTGTTMVGGGTLLFTANVPSGGNSQFGNSTSAIILGDANAAAALGSEISGTVAGTTLSRPITSGSGTGAIALSGRATSGSVTFAGALTLSRAVSLFSTMNQASETSVGSVNFTGKISGAGPITIGGTDAFSGQARSWSHVILSNSTSDYSGGTTLSAGTLGFGESSSGTTGPLGSGPVTLGATGAEIPTLYALGTARSVHNSITFANNAVFAGSHLLTFAGPVALGNAERILTVESGANVRFSSAMSGLGSLSKEGPGTLTLGSTSSYSGPTGVFDGTLALDASQTPSALNIGSGATVVVTSGGNKVLRTANLKMVDGSALDLTDEDAILDYTGASLLTSTRSRIISGYNNGLWNGAGIRSSSAPTSTGPKAGLGYGEASVVLGPSGGNFSSNSVDGTTVLIRYTALGDANLNGLVDSVDFGFLTANFGKASDALWTEGDFDYNGKVNTLDFNELSGNFGMNLPAPLPSPSLGTIVPEPTSGVLVGGLLAILRRRRIS
jgi:autotransporter-associated beta strand protein